MILSDHALFELLAVCPHQIPTQAFLEVVCVREGGGKWEGGGGRGEGGGREGEGGGREREGEGRGRGGEGRGRGGGRGGGGGGEGGAGGRGEYNDVVIVCTCVIPHSAMSLPPWSVPVATQR